ncbi:uncharacterized protein LOC116352349 [Contarinia nasturtii]|uniref:uncharacterized protein LOC116352349 n=1 Tax=Contarinia nasturtii TaxID=265458 RepID=UPI0012D457A3|nr:uncharacterized protein LOC116352349 [Contarinia nasturtii]
MLSQRIAWNVFRLKQTISYVSRPFSSLSQTHMKLSLNHSRLKQINAVGYSTNNNHQPLDGSKYERKLPKLVDDKIVIAPSFFPYFLVNRNARKIKNSLDSEFSLDDFKAGSMKAIEIISDKLASADFDGLHGLVTDEVIDRLRHVIVTMTDEQRSRLRVKMNDIPQFLVSSIEIKEKNDSTCVDISLICKAVLTADLDIDASSKDFTISHFHIRYMLNYTFTKEFSPNSNDDWIVSFINHANMLDELQTRQQN